MAVSTFNMVILGRGDNRSVQKQAAYGSGDTIKTVKIGSIVSAVSYRSGEQLRDEQQERTFDYSNREDVQHKQMLVPEIAPEYAHDREQYWNEVDRREHFKNAQLARSIIVGLPRELTLDQNIDFLEEYLHKEYVSKGVVVDYAIHDSLASDGGRNPHAHVLVSMRGFEEKTKDDGTTEVVWKKQKARELNGYDETRKYDEHGKFIPAKARFFSLKDWRERWETLQNSHLAKAGSEATVNMQSYEAQGIDQEPTLHVGYKANELEKQGIATEVGDKNRAIIARNEARTQEKMQQGTVVADDAPEQPQNAPEQQKQPTMAQPLQDKDKPPNDAPKRQPEPTSASGWQWMKDTATRWQQTWDKQADKMTQGYRHVAGHAMLENMKRKWRVSATQDMEASKEKKDYKQKPPHLWSLEQKEDYRKMHPYLEAQAELSRRERAQAIAVVMQHAERQRQMERQRIMQRIAQQQENYRYRSIVQDRPPPERKR